MTVTYLGFMLLPVAYFAMDRKMLSSVLPKPVAALPTSANSNKKATEAKKQDQPATAAQDTDESR